MSVPYRFAVWKSLSRTRCTRPQPQPKSNTFIVGTIGRISTLRTKRKLR